MQRYNASGVSMGLDLRTVKARPCVRCDQDLPDGFWNVAGKGWPNGMHMVARKTSFSPALYASERMGWFGRTFSSRYYIFSTVSHCINL